jgi:phosphoserine phosphatase
LKGIEDYAADMREFWDKHEHRLRPFYKRLQRPDDLIISAGPEQSLWEICGRLGVKHFIGSVINEATGQLEFACFRENKVKAFRERWPGQEIDSFYTDSMNDKPLMDIAREVFMVKKNGLVQIK